MVAIACDTFLVEATGEMRSLTWQVEKLLGVGSAGGELQDTVEYIAKSAWRPDLGAEFESCAPRTDQSDHVVRVTCHTLRGRDST